MKPLRIYLDTSVLGGCEDPEFAEDSLRLIERVRLGRFTALLSDVLDEWKLANALHLPGRSLSRQIGVAWPQHKKHYRQ